MNKNEINPFNGKPLNPEMEVTQKDGKTTRVEYIEDYFKETGVFDHSFGGRVFRLNRKLTKEEWNLVKSQFKNYKQGWFKWGTPKPNIVISLLVKAKNPNIDHVVCRHKLTVEDCIYMREHGANLRDGVTGEYLLPIE